MNERKEGRKENKYGRIAKERKGKLGQVSWWVSKKYVKK